jgi:hypothetical protein
VREGVNARASPIPTIYLSSTYDDFKDYRLAVFEALRKSGYQVIAMEDYVATDQRRQGICDHAWGVEDGPTGCYRAGR